MFLETEDYKAVCDPDDLDVIIQSDTQSRQRAERTAMEEISLYLRGRYDIAKAFAATGEERNFWLIQITVNIVLYYMIHWLPQNMGFDARKQLYDDAIARLKDVQSGRATPDLPTYTNSQGGTDTANPMRYGSMSPNIYDY